MQMGNLLNGNINMKKVAIETEYFLYENDPLSPILTKDGMYFGSIESARSSNFSYYSNKARFKIGKVMKTVNLVGEDCDPASAEDIEYENAIQKIREDVDKEWETVKRDDSDEEEEFEFKTARTMVLRWEYLRNKKKK